MNHTATLAVLAVLAVLCSAPALAGDPPPACIEGSEVPASPKELGAARKRADAHLAALRAGRWLQAADLVVVVRRTPTGMRDVVFDDVHHPGPPQMKAAVVARLKDMYGRARPGKLSGEGRVTEHCRLAPLDVDGIGRQIGFDDEHGALDALGMKLVDGRWYRVLELATP